jgi:hypothetical protein
MNKNSLTGSSSMLGEIDECFYTFQVDNLLLNDKLN